MMLLLAGVKKAVVDPFFNYVTLLLPGNGANGAQNNTFVDSSTNAFTITRNGNTTQGTFSPFSQTGWSAYFDGNGDYISFTNPAETGSFTCECWFYRGEDVAGYHILFSGSNLSTINVNNCQLAVNNDGSAVFGLNGATASATTATGLVVKNQWNHIAFVRSSTSCAIFINGSRASTGTSSATLNIVSIGTYLSNYQPNGYISDVRITDTAVYDVAQTTYTVPTAPLTAISGTYLLTLQNNRFVDNSASPLALTINGNPSIQAFSPFNPTAVWDAATNGGSGYFDGSGDYLTTASSTNLALGSGDFTVDVWFYPTTTNAYFPIDFRTGCTLYFYVTSGTTVNVAIGGNSETTFSGVVTNAWNHFACVRSGSGSNNVSYYLNGVRGAQQTDTTNFSSATTITLGKRYIAFSGSDFYFQGYLSNARLVVGTAIYSGATYTVPTAPLTAISNTQLLCNFTNAGIYDATAKNDLETVGNAQISTTQSQWGGSSIAFDGTGDWLLSNVATPNLYAFGTGDFTIEMWARFAAVGSGAVHHFYDNRPASTDGAYTTLRTNSSAQLEYVANGTARITGATLTTGVWYHIAVCRSGTDTKLFVNGVQSGSTYTDSTNYLNPAARPLVGASGYHLAGLNGFNGYIQDVRVTKGYARYTTGFTPPTAAFPIQ